MGSWGEESCSSDSCWDFLADCGLEDICDFSQKEADACVSKGLKIVKKKKNIDAEDQADFVGMLIWILRDGKTINNKESLEVGIDFAQKLLEDKEYLENWVDIKGRKNNLRKEIKQMKKALETGNIKKEHSPGLLEGMSEKLLGEK